MSGAEKFDCWNWNWKWTAGVLCLVGLLKEFQPSEPFLVDYAVEFQNFTTSEMVHDVLPATTYGYFASILVLLLVTDFLRYKPVIIFGGAASVICWVMAIWFYSTKVQAQVRQVFEAIGLSTEIAYFTYMYANVDRSHYRIVTSWSHIALHIGRFLGGAAGQLLISSKLLDYRDLNYVTLGGVSFSFIVSFFLPKVRRSIYFDPRFSVISTLNTNIRISQSQTVLPDQGRSASLDASTISTIAAAPRKMTETPKQVTFKKRIIRASRALWRDLTRLHFYTLKWCLWWSIAQAIYLQVSIYAEPLWKEIEEETHESIYNGVIDASHALLSAIIGVLIAFLRFPMLKWGEIYLSTISILQGAVLLWMSQTHELYIAYGCYILFQTSFQVVIIIATAEVAEGVMEDSEAFIFGLNTLIALVIQSILTYVVADESGLNLGIRQEFVVYSAYLGILGLIFLLIGLQRRTRHWDIEVGIANDAYVKNKEESTPTHLHTSIHDL